MLRSIRKMSGKGDEMVAEWDTDVVSPERLEEIEKEFNEMTKKGYLAFDVTDQKDVQIKEFSPEAEILMIPRMQGGRR